MLEIGLHPNPEIAAQLVLAYNRWFVKDILPKDSRMRSLLALPFEDPDACLKTIREHADNPSVLGFMITSQRGRHCEGRGHGVADTRHTNCCVTYSSGLADGGKRDMIMIGFNHRGIGNPGATAPDCSTPIRAARSSWPRSILRSIR